MSEGESLPFTSQILFAQSVMMASNSMMTKPSAFNVIVSVVRAMPTGALDASQVSSSRGQLAPPVIQLALPVLGQPLLVIAACLLYR